MITILEWLKRNGVHKSIIEKGRGIVAVRVASDQPCDTVVNDQNTNEAIYMKKIDDLKFEVDENKDKVFVIGIDQWSKMTKKNLFISKLKGNTNV